MPCCTFDRRPDAHHPLGILVVCGPLLLGVTPLAAGLGVVGRVSPALERVARRAWSLVRVVRDVVATDFLHPRYRCGLSARLMVRHPRFAGWIYRQLNVLVLVALWGLVLAIATGSVAALAWS